MFSIYKTVSSENSDNFIYSFSILVILITFLPNYCLIALVKTTGPMLERQISTYSSPLLC
jgi:hypothetical protein